MFQLSPHSTLSEIRRRLLRWYDSHQRRLPWRNTKDPYAIWVAETMLQQTQVKTALPFYHRFLSALPTLKDLDRAPKARVLSLWSGLGYYRRAENLKKAARTLSQRFGGELPADFEALLSLPGVGRYTAGAVMSIAFDRAYPALDGNARRVLSRLFRLSSDSQLTNAAWQLLPASRPGRFNQALMELGATLCAPRHSSCGACPLVSLCVAATTGSFPKTTQASRPSTQRVCWPLVIAERGGRILLRRRNQRGLLAGLWEIPGGQKGGREKCQTILARHLGVPAGQENGLLKIGEIQHTITHYRITAPLFVYSGLPVIQRFDSSWRWVPTKSLARYPLSSLTLKALQLFREWQRSLQTHADA